MSSRVKAGSRQPGCRACAPGRLPFERISSRTYWLLGLPFTSLMRSPATENPHFTHLASQFCSTSNTSTCIPFLAMMAQTYLPEWSHENSVGKRSPSRKSKQAGWWVPLPSLGGLSCWWVSMYRTSWGTVRGVCVIIMLRAGMNVYICVFLI